MISKHQKYVSYSIFNIIDSNVWFWSQQPNKYDNSLVFYDAQIIIRIGKLFGTKYYEYNNRLSEKKFLWWRNSINTIGKNNNRLTIA